MASKNLEKNEKNAKTYQNLLTQLNAIFALAPGKHEIRVIGRWYEIEYQGKKIYKTIKDQSGEKDKVFAIGLCKTSEEAITAIQRHFGTEEPHNCFIVTNTVADTFNLEMKPLRVADSAKKFTPVSYICTNASNIIGINSVIIDIDRPETAKNEAGQKLCASPQELEQLDLGRKAVVEYLNTFKITPAYQICSGNGYQLGIFFNVQDNPAKIALTRKTIKTVLCGLSKRFESTGINIDITLEDPSRVTRLVNTWNKKSDRAEDMAQARQYRLATLLECAETPIINNWEDILSLANAMQEFATQSKAVKPAVVAIAHAPDTEKETDHHSSTGSYDSEEYLRKFIAENGIEVSKEKTDASCRIRFNLTHCIFDPSHTKDEASLFIGPSGAIGYQCFHNSCKSRFANCGEAWKEAKAQFNWSPRNNRPCKTCGKDIYFEQTEKGWRAFTAKTGKIHRCAKKNTPKNDFVVDSIKINGTTIKAPGNPAQKPTPAFDWINEKGGVITGIAAQAFLASQDKPLIYTQANFWQYENGIWQKVEFDKIEKDIADMIGPEKSTKKRVQDIVYNLSLQTQKTITWNPFPMKLCFTNGVLDVETQLFESHNKEYYQTNQFAFEYAPEKVVPSQKWLKFINSLGFKQDTICRLQEWFGYCLVPVVPMERCLFLKGEGANGKSTLLETLQHMLGENQYSTLETSELFEPFMLSQIQNRLVNVAADIDTNDIFSTRFKKMVTGERMTARNIYNAPFQFNPFAKLLFSANDFIPTRDRSKGFYRRFDVIEFQKEFTEKEQDKGLKKALKLEVPKIFFWALAGLYRLMQNNWIFTESEEFTQTKQKFEKESNPVLCFLEENYTVTPKDSPEWGKDINARIDKISTKEFRRDYVQWCLDNGYRTISETSLGKELLRLGIEKKRCRDGLTLNYVYFGLKKGNFY